ncbi:MAG: chemotaxis protein CheR [Labilithrix sp.]|nr:chemotaxis protein CheR [Labilithrix sp.]
MTDETVEQAPGAGAAEEGADAGPVVDPEGLETLLEFLKQNRAFDFGGYKRASLSRRILQRMNELGIPSYAAYIEHLEVHADEFPRLFNTILINVTSFFREPSCWVALGEQVRRILALKARTEPLRIWSAGCSSGEEPYTIAMLLAELIGIEEVNRRVKIYATDIDDEALRTARAAVYPARALEHVPAEFAAKYFAPSAGGFAFTKELRRDVIFGRHDLLQDAPISRIDVVSCRNTMMYFNAETQAKALQSLHYALLPHGVLLLGKAEMLLTHSHLFTPLDLKQRLFQPAPRGQLRAARVPAQRRPRVERSEAEHQGVLRAAVDAVPVAIIVLDPEGQVSLVNTQAATLFGISGDQVGRRLEELSLAFPPPDVSAYIDSARHDARAHALRGVEWAPAANDPAFLDIDICPLFGDAGALVGVQLAFRDITTAQRLKAEVQRAHVELAAAHQELQSTNDELQSTVEELETTNEELQSTNEELETINEELQSTTEEMMTVADDMRQRDADLMTANGFLAGVLGSLTSGVAVLDADFRLKAWNPRMEELWGVRADEVIGASFFGLDIGLPLEPLRSAIQEALDAQGSRKVMVDGTNRRGRPMKCVVVVSPLLTGPGGVMVMVDEATS